MIQRREDESITAFTIRKLSCEIVCVELVELAQYFEAVPEQHWTGAEIGDFLLNRTKDHPTFTNG